MTTLTRTAALTAMGLALAACSAAPSGPQTVDLGIALDRTVSALQSFQSYMESENQTEVSDADMEAFRGFLTEMYNDPGFYDQPTGVIMREDGAFLAYVDANQNDTQDVGEDDLFTIEIDEENERLIASDASGNATGRRFSGTGFLAGYLVARMLGRQSRAGIARGSFNNRNVTPRASYRAPASARSRASSARSSTRSGGTRSGK